MQVASVLFVLRIAALYWRDGRRKPKNSEHTQPFRVPWLGLAAGVAVWSVSLTVGFISDDFAHLYHASGHLWPQLWSLFINGQDETFMRPVGFASIFLDHSLWGQWAAGYHLTNLGLHLAAVAGFYTLNRTLGASKNHAAFIAGVYICMPVQVEAVAWMGARFDLLSNALTIWAAVFYLWYRESSRVPTYATALFLYLLATFSKENGFVLPLLIVVIEFLFFSPRKIWAPIGLFGAGLLSFAYRWYALKGVGGYSSGGKLSALDIGPKTLEGFLLRGPTQLFSGLNWTQPPGWIVIVLGSLSATTLLLLSFKGSPSPQNWRCIKLGGAWALISMAPAHFLLMVGASLTNSRVFYMASAGAAFVLGHLVLALPKPKARETAMFALVLLMSLGVAHNISAWRWASRASAEVLAAVVRLEPSPPPQAEFVFENMPQTLRGVFFFQVGLTEGLRLVYGRPDVSAQREEQHSAPTHAIRLLWTGDPARMIERQPEER